MKVELDPKKSVEANAAVYYEKAKKYRKKIEGVKKAIEETKRLLEKAELEHVKKTKLKKRREKEWFEKFHWMFIDGHLVIGGRDAKSNELLVKKHMEKNDLFFHADVHGASVVIVKNGQELDDSDLEKAAVFAGCFSNAWKAGRGTVDVYCVKPEQVKTAAKAGEYLAKGSFVIEGQRKWFKNVELKLCLSFDGSKLFIAPCEMIKGKKVMIAPDVKKTKGESAREILKAIHKLFPESTEAVDVNWVIELIPNGGSRIIRR